MTWWLITSGCKVRNVTHPRDPITEVLPKHFLSNSDIVVWDSRLRCLPHSVTHSTSYNKVLSPGTHYSHVTWVHVMLRVQLECERRFNIEFYGADTPFCHSAYVTWFHVPARPSHFCCRTHFVRRDIQTLSSVVWRNGGNAYWKQSGQTSHKEVEVKNILFVSAGTLKPMRLESYFPRMPGAKSSHETTWHDDMRVCHLTWRELTWRKDSVFPCVWNYVYF